MTNFNIGTKIEHPTFGKGVIIDNEDEYTYIIYFYGQGEKEISKSFDGMLIIKTIEKDANSISFDDIEKGVISCFACGILIKFIFVFDFA